MNDKTFQGLAGISHEGRTMVVRAWAFPSGDDWVVLPNTPYLIVDCRTFGTPEEARAYMLGFCKEVWYVYK